MLALNLVGASISSVLAGLLVQRPTVADLIVAWLGPSLLSAAVAVVVAVAFSPWLGYLSGTARWTKRIRAGVNLFAACGYVPGVRHRGLSRYEARRCGGAALALPLLASLLVIVDEPTAGLDPEERMRFRTLLASLGGDRTVILSTHILDDVSQTCPKVAVLTKARLVFHGATSSLVEAAAGKTFTVATPGRRAKGLPTWRLGRYADDFALGLPSSMMVISPLVPASV